MTPTMKVKTTVKPNLELAPKHRTMCRTWRPCVQTWLHAVTWAGSWQNILETSWLNALRAKAFSDLATTRKSADAVLADPVSWPGENTSSLTLVCCVNLQNRITILARRLHFPSHHWWGIACFWEGDQPRRSSGRCAEPCPESCRSICQSQTCALWSWYNSHNEWSPSVQCQALLQPAWHQLQLVEQGNVKAKVHKTAKFVESMMHMHIEHANYNAGRGACTHVQCE